jgi:hypothetical protein
MNFVSEHYEDGEYGDYESVGTPMVGARFSYLLKKRLDSVRYSTRRFCYVVYNSRLFSGSTIVVSDPLLL